ncbi:MAG TPA: hypothetical protein VE082_06305 [Desulfobaccales bacterium]|jgi:hypothetical protein|nr:hypothetical protein [Desulfobaccales bacterium]
MATYICKTCGVQYADSERPPARCIICEDERQYIGWQGQQWTTLEEMRQEGYHNEFRDLEPGITGIATTPSFAIGQRALLVERPQGNFLWDCISFIDDETVERIQSLGGLRGLSVSHPHFYSAIVEWSKAFGGIPVYLPEDDRQWVTRPDSAIRYWRGVRELGPGATLIQCGGHFPGSTVFHWAAGAGGKGVLLVGDTMAVAQDRRHVSFMYSYPNLIPLPAAAIRGILAALEPYAFDRIYSAFRGKEIMAGGRQAVERSAARYLRQIQG